MATSALWESNMPAISNEYYLFIKHSLQMPNKYVRKSVNIRGNWSEENLINAVNNVSNGNMSVRRASLTFNIPRKTLERRVKTGNTVKGSMGPGCNFGKENEDRLSRYILNMQSRGFPLTRDDLRTIAFQFAEQMNIKHRFNKEVGKAGYDWLCLFLSRNPQISVRKSEGVSLARTTAMNRKEVDEYFGLLEQIMTDYSLFEKPANIFNIDETGLQLNNRPGEVLAKKGSKAVSTITSTEKGETITLVACCNAEGSFVPPAIIMKGKNKKKEWEDALPPGSVLYMSEKSAYINATLFLQWIRDHFMPRKPLGYVLLILDGHASHVNSVEMLEFAESHQIILLCLPSHTTHYLQPLDRSFFKSLKAHFYESCRLWLKTHAGRRITRYQFGELLTLTWGKAATTQNGSSGFKAAGIFPFNRHAIPDYAFAVEESIAKNTETEITRDKEKPEEKAMEVADEEVQPLPCSSKEDTITPSKLLYDMSPSVPEKVVVARKRSKQLASVLTSPEHLQVRREKENKLKEIENRKRNLKGKENRRPIKSKKKKGEPQDVSSSSEEDINMILESEDSGDEDLTENLCIGCGEDYNHTKKAVDWIKCVNCLRWLHETCTTYGDFCQKWGKLDLITLKGKKKK
ncbi:hypothetical protein PPYR_15330 [Photinus pyralis]|uniref:HTH CENPB-type domain-containing protein n=1 Tax=Photinus pyralis TaxID=7054 RepID=A0A5N3ZZ53_PHOPY|nr:hypothetical protein PPYR_15330 [Photinus pyralis]